ncbi:Pimeloyl-ACP methyl ester carboxylesterase [Cyclonatronum proteinivorum]|uniref:Pimeloyl-ACP methyl ester carboxylesterase n=1 Tax=Cyclonatronum proteinivorum TaxID=1457365 RepID=A0A345UHR8_9BACT|nr:alpha/beta hydrolase [Cyclonatronum proteinivorum]AXJ00020.1 Pimeloyl-ACP methyl ester carboxylesterase [Cyclonatronum proteinivorum]
MKWYLILITAALLVLTSCAGVRYADKPALEFQDIDYGFAVNFSQGTPQIAYIDEGAGDKTLLLVHGLASNAGFWRYNIAALSEHHRVIAVDLPGYGKSEKGGFPYGMAFWAETLADFIDELGLENVVYVGHSMGGQIGMTLAINHPEAISELVLAAPAGVESFSPGSGDWLRSVFTMEGVKRTPEPQIRENLSINFYRWDNAWEWMVEERVRMAKAADMDEFAYTVVQSISAMLDEPTTHRLHQVSHPTLIVYGRYDGLIPNRFLNPGFPAAVFALAHEQIPDSRLVEINNAGHMLMIEKPAEFNAAVLEFTRR